MEIKVNKSLSPSDGFRKWIRKESFSELHRKSLGISYGCGKLEEVRVIIGSFGPKSSSIAMATQLQVSPDNHDINEKESVVSITQSTPFNNKC